MGEGMRCGHRAVSALFLRVSIPKAITGQVLMEFYAEGVDTIASVARPEPANPDERFMLRAVEMAEKGRGWTGTNPLVGAIIVSAGEVVGEGYHERIGGPHAEANALSEAGDRANGATMYVTLEPCNHHGRTPPCTERIIRAGIGRVVVALRDPNKAVPGGGLSALRSAGVDVVMGPYERLVRRQNEAYLTGVTERRPFVTLKMAMSLDGRAATRDGDSRWISARESREDVHRMRLHSDAVMVGIGTVLADDPRLTVRLPGAERTPLRVVVDSRARTPINSNVADVSQAPTLVAVAAAAEEGNIRKLEERGVEVARAGPGQDVDLEELLSLLYKRGVASLMVEGGPELASGLLTIGLIDRFVFFIAPKLIGGRGAPGPIGGPGPSLMGDVREVRIDAVFASGVDMKVVAYPDRRYEPCSRG